MDRIEQSFAVTALTSLFAGRRAEPCVWIDLSFFAVSSVNDEASAKFAFASPATQGRYCRKVGTVRRAYAD